MRAAASQTKKQEKAPQKSSDFSESRKIKVAGHA